MLYFTKTQHVGAMSSVAVYCKDASVKVLPKPIGLLARVGEHDWKTNNDLHRWLGVGLMTDPDLMCLKQRVVDIYKRKELWNEPRCD